MGPHLFLNNITVHGTSANVGRRFLFLLGRRWESGFLNASDVLTRNCLGPGSLQEFKVSGKKVVAPTLPRTRRLPSKRLAGGIGYCSDHTSALRVSELRSTAERSRLRCSSFNESIAEVPSRNREASPCWGDPSRDGKVSFYTHPK